MGNTQRSEWFHAEHEATDRVSCPKCSKAFIKFEYNIDIEAPEECASCEHYLTNYGKNEIFMCPDHKDRAYCSNCHDIRSEMEIYEQLTSKIKRIPTMRLREQLTEQIRPCLSKMKRKAVIHVDLILSYWLNHQYISGDICSIILSYLKNATMKYKVAKHSDLVNVFGKIWDLLCFDSQPTVRRKTRASERNKGMAYNACSTTFRTHRLQMSERELCKLSDDRMWKKRMAPNIYRMQYNKFRGCDLSEPFFRKVKDQKAIKFPVCRRLGIMMDILADDFKAIHLLLNDWNPSYRMDKVPICIGKGECIIFTIDKCKDSDLFVVMRYNRNDR